MARINLPTLWFKLFASELLPDGQQEAVAGTAPDQGNAGSPALL